MNSSRRLFAVGAFLLFVLQGCPCPGGGGGGGLVYGELVIRTDEGVSSSAELDFGTVSMGTTATKKLVLLNVGRARIIVRGFTKPDASQAATKAGTVNDANPVFTVTASDEVVIASGETVELDVAFSPPVVETDAERAYRVALNITADGLPLEAVSTFTLIGNSVSGECALPANIDFGAVAIGDTFPRTYDFVNPRGIETHAYLGPIESQQGDGIFSISPESPKNEFLLGAMNTRTATFHFRPTQAREYVATVRMRRSDACPEKPVRLQGIGVAAVITWAPAELRFGYSPLRNTLEREVVFSNFSVNPVTLSALRAADQTTPNVPSNIFKVVDPLGSLELPAASRDVDGMLRPGVAAVKLSFTPTTLGPRRGALTAATTLPTQALVSVPLHGIGGGPDIEVRPAPVISLGRIAYFPGASPASFAQSQFRIQNVGTPAAASDPDGNLKLGELDSAGQPTRYWDVVPLNGALREEICVGVFNANDGACDERPPTYDTALGLIAGASVNVPVRITPNGFGVREFELRIFSSDADEPVTTVTITANAVNVPECDVEITPIALPFGIVTPPAVHDSSFSIRNRRVAAGEVCLITNLQMGPETGTPAGMPPIFSLPLGTLSELELQPAETKQILVRAWPQAQLPPTPTQVSGRVQFNLAHRTAPSREVAVTATIANSCLTISPRDLNFGTVQRECASATKTFLMYNTCSTPVTINTASMGAPAGEAPGGPNCPGSAPCPEFHVVSGLSGNTVVAPGATTPVTFQLRYRPINLGPDSGAFVINVTQGGQPLDYVVTLRGVGDTQGLNTDTFRQTNRREADILLAIDKSGSMGLEQEKLATNLNSFLAFAEAERVDFHMAAINTELTDPNRGVFNVSTAGHRYLRPDTLNLQQEFASIVQVPLAGGTESCMEPATLALTAPLINDPTKNGGFLRNDAVLAVVCVTDAPDQAPQPPAFYLNQLIAIKGAQRQTDFTYNVIGPFLPNNPAQCGYDGANDTRHSYLVQQTNGVQEEICLDDWSAGLERIGKKAFGYRLNFFLTATPDLSSPHGIRVTVNDVVLPEIDPDPALNSRIWEYDATNNSVVFQPLYVPGAGDTLTVTYQVACLP